MQAVRSRPSLWTLPTELGPLAEEPRFPKASFAVTPIPPNGFISKKHREAALRERGLLPPRKDLSGQECEADEPIVRVPSEVTLVDDEATEAERFKASWLAMDQNCVPTPDASVVRRSGEGRTDLPEDSSRRAPVTSSPSLQLNPSLSVPERGDVRFPAFFQRTRENSGDRPPKAVGLSRFGTGSLVNLLRSTRGRSTASIAQHEVPRKAVDPTMHSMERILRETSKIKDPESRRLSERAYLD